MKEVIIIIPDHLFLPPNNISSSLVQRRPAPRGRGSSRAWPPSGGGSTGGVVGGDGRFSAVGGAAATYWAAADSWVLAVGVAAATYRAAAESSGLGGEAARASRGQQQNGALQVNCTQPSPHTTKHANTKYAISLNREKPSWSINIVVVLFNILLFSEQRN